MRTASIQAGRTRKSRATACFVICVCALALVMFSRCGGSDDPAGPSNETTDPETGTVIDIDGNTYLTIKIGDQWWMAENLKVAHYRTGTGIVNAIDVTPYGRLYTRAAVLNTAGLAPAGWHVPSDAEWQTLVDYLGGDAVAGGKMKETGTTHWVSPNTGATNEYGFGALPAGYWEGYDGTRHGVGYTAYFWSGGDTPVGNWYRSIGYNGTQVNRSETGSTALTASDALSIRCVKD